MPRPEGPKGFLALILAISAGILFDRHARRRAMFAVVLAAAAMLFVGAVVLDAFLMARPILFLLFWTACAFIAGFAILLALYDMLALQREARALKRRLHGEIFADRKPGEDGEPPADP